MSHNSRFKRASFARDRGLFKARRAASESGDAWKAPGERNAALARNAKTRGARNRHFEQEEAERIAVVKRRHAEEMALRAKPAVDTQPRRY